MTPLITSRRRRHLLPHHLLEALLPLLGELEDLFDAIGHTLNDDRWTEVHTKLSDARDVLRKPSALFERLKEQERRLAERTATAAIEIKKQWWPPRKGMARVAPLANKIVRRRR